MAPSCYSDPFWGLVLLSCGIGIAGTIVLCCLWELAKLAWSRRPAHIKPISDRRRESEIRRLQRLAANIDDHPLFPWPIAKGGSN